MYGWQILISWEGRRLFNISYINPLTSCTSIEHYRFDTCDSATYSSPNACMAIFLYSISPRETRRMRGGNVPLPCPLPLLLSSATYPCHDSEHSRQFPNPTFIYRIEMAEHFPFENHQRPFPGGLFLRILQTSSSLGRHRIHHHYFLTGVSPSPVSVLSLTIALKSCVQRCTVGGIARLFSRQGTMQRDARSRRLF